MLPTPELEVLTGAFTTPLSTRAGSARSSIPATPTFVKSASGESQASEASVTARDISDMPYDPRLVAIKREYDANVVKVGHLARRFGMFFYNYRDYTVYLLDNGQM